MKKLLLSILVASIGTFVSNAQLLWEVTGNGLSKPSYLFGTHHIAPVSVMDSVPGFASALASADKVYGEMVMSEAQTPQSQQVMLTYAMAPQDSTLTSVLPPSSTLSTKFSSTTWARWPLLHRWQHSNPAW